MRRAHSLLLAVAACLPLAGCYYDPDYGYVRNSTGADAYYGEETVVSPGAYSPGYRYYDYGPACCYSGLSVGTVWYDGYDGRRYRRGGDWHGHPPPRGDWHDRHDNDRRPGDGWRGDNRPGNWRGDNRPDRGDHRPGNWQGGGGGGNRPSGGWHGGDRGGEHRPAPSATPRAAPPVRQAGTGRDRSRFRSDTD